MVHGPLLPVLFVVVNVFLPFRHCFTTFEAIARSPEFTDEQIYEIQNGAAIRNINPVEKMNERTYGIFHSDSLPYEAKIQDILENIILNYQNMEKQFKSLKVPISGNSGPGEAKVLVPEFKLEIPEHDLIDLENFFPNTSNRDGRFFKFNMKKNDECRRRSLALEYLLFSFSGRISALAGTVGSLSNNINNVLTQQNSIAISNSNVQGPITNILTATATNDVDITNLVTVTGG